jgi:hypothetical protein
VCLAGEQIQKHLRLIRRHGQPNLGALKLIIFIYQSPNPKNAGYPVLNISTTATAFSIRLPMTALSLCLELILISAMLLRAETNKKTARNADSMTR